MPRIRSSKCLLRRIAISTKARNVLFTLCGVAGLMLKGLYRGRYQVLIHSYCGNIAVSFAVYFLLANLPLYVKLGRLPTAGCALAVVGLFEATNGFHLMTNTYDPLDYAANAAASKIVCRLKPNGQSA